MSSFHSLSCFSLVSAMGCKLFSNSSKELSNKINIIPKERLERPELRRCECCCCCCHCLLSRSVISQSYYYATLKDEGKVKLKERAISVPSYIIYILLILLFRYMAQENPLSHWIFDVDDDDDEDNPINKDGTPMKRPSLLQELEIDPKHIYRYRISNLTHPLRIS